MGIGSRYILASVTCFSLVNLLAKLLSGLPFEQLVFWRGFLCLIFTVAVLKARKTPIWGSNKKLLILRGVSGTISLSAFFYSVHHMPLASAVTIQYVSPIFTVLIAGLFFGERVLPLHWLCSFVGFLGVWIIQGFDDKVALFDAGVGLIGAFFTGIAYNSVRGLRDTDDEWVVMFYFPLIASVLTFPFAWNSWVWPEGWQWGGVILLAALVQLAQFFLTRGYSLAKASEVSSVSYAGVALATAYDYFIFSHRVTAATLVGMGLIVLSVSLSGLRRDRPFAASRS